MAETTFHSITLPGANPARVPLTAVEFSTSTVYKVRDYCTYQGKLYICSTAHAAGAWNAAHFTEVNVGDEINTRLVVPPTTEPASTDRRVGDLWIDVNTESPVISVDPQPVAGSTNVPQSGGTFNLIKNLDNNKAGKSLLTGDFSATSPYSVNDLCIHDGYLYRCIVDIPTGAAWDASKWQATTIETELARIESEAADLDVIAETFGDSNSYAVGDYVLHTTNGADKLYRCTNAVSDTSVWNSQYWSEVKLADEVSDLKSILIEQLGPNYKVLLQKGESAGASGKLIPFIIKTGDSITASSHDGTTFGEVQLRFYDENKTYIDYRALSSGYGNSRTFTSNLSKTSFYVGITTVDVTSPSLYDVFNNSNEYYTDIKFAIDESIIAKSILPNLPFIGKSFIIKAGETHSSLNDQLEVNLKTGEKYRVIKTDGLLYAFYSDGTSQIVDINGIAQKDIISFGIYKSNETISPIEIRFFVIQDPVGVDIYDSTSKIDTVDSHLTEALKTTGIDPIVLSKKKAILIVNDIVAMQNDVPVLNDSTIYDAGYITCSEGDQFTINGSGGETSRLYAFINSNGNVITKSSGTVTLTDVIITAPANTAFLIVNTKDNRMSYIGKIIKKRVQDLEEKTNEFDSNIENTKKLLVNGYYTQQTETGYAVMNNEAIGAVVNLTPVASENNASIIVPGISEGMKFLIFGAGTYNYLFWSFLDKERKLISKANSWANSGSTGAKITAPAGSYYLVCSGVADYVNGFNVQFLSASDYIAEQIGSSGDNSETIMANFKKNADFTFSFFSDVHGGSTNVQHIINHAADNSVDTIINGGDTILRYLDDPNESFAWYEEVLSQSNVDILSAVGNHDAWKGDYWVKAPATEVYNAIIKPVVTNFSGIVQPTSAEANGLCYYYKDYGNVRVIIINAMAGSATVSFWDSAQATWFTNVLSDAKINNKHVIVCTHGPYPKSIAQRDEKSNWNSWIDYRTWASSDNIVIETEPLNLIKTFIENGGKFICLLTGHEHCDNILFATGYENILMVNVASAKYTNHSDGLYYSDPESQYYDCFNYCAVDTTNGIMKMIRVGWDMDAALKKRETFAYNYITSKIIKE